MRSPSGNVAVVGAFFCYGFNDFEPLDGKIFDTRHFALHKTARLMALAIFQTAVDLCSGYARLPTCIPVINGMNKLYLLSMKFSIFAWRFTCVLFKYKREMALGSKAEKGTYSK